MISRLNLGGSARKSRRHSRRRSATLSSAKTARRSDTWLVRSGALPVALEPISGPFVAPGSFCSRLAAAVRPCGSAAELIGRRVKLLELGRIGITRWPRESRWRGRPRRGRFRHAPGGRRSRDGEGRSARRARYAATRRAEIYRATKETDDAEVARKNAIARHAMTYSWVTTDGTGHSWVHTRPIYYSQKD